MDDDLLARATEAALATASAVLGLPPSALELRLRIRPQRRYGPRPRHTVEELRSAVAEHGGYRAAARALGLSDAAVRKRLSDGD
jgi:hypothetical protein